MRRVIPLLLVATAANAPADDKRCVVEKPLVVTPSKAKAPACKKPKAAIAKSITAEIAKKYNPEHKGKPDVKFPCDGLGPKIYEIVVERGNGHGGTFQLWRARRRDDGKYDARGILYHGSSMTHRAADPPHEQAAGIVALPELDKARAAMTATVREVVPPVPKGEFHGTASSWSSRSFHVAIRLVDDQGRVVEKRYTGYASSSGQDTFLGLEIAEAALAPITSIAPNKNAADSDDKLFFAASFNAAVPLFDGDFYWWVMERYVDLARYLGTNAVIGGLLTRLAITKQDRSKIDARANAVDAISRITGWDARDGGKKTIEEAAAAYLAACK